MKFEEIFNEPGLYVAESFIEGAALSVDEDGNLFNVWYVDTRDMRPLKERQMMNKSLLENDYKKVYTLRQLFGEKRKKLF